MAAGIKFLCVVFTFHQWHLKGLKWPSQNHKKKSVTQFWIIRCYQLGSTKEVRTMLICDVTLQLNCFLLSQLWITWLTDVTYSPSVWAVAVGVSIMASMQVRVQSLVTAFSEFDRTPVWYFPVELSASSLLYMFRLKVGMTVAQKRGNHSLLAHRCVLALLRDTTRQQPKSKRPSEPSEAMRADVRWSCVFPQ